MIEAIDGFGLVMGEYLFDVVGVDGVLDGEDVLQDV